MSKKYIDKDVYQSAMGRIDFIFNEFDNPYVSFSGGKDSGVLLNLVLKYMKEKKIKKRLPVYYMDYEGSYQYTEDFIKRMVETHADMIDLYWVCLTYKTKCGVSIYKNYWLPWNPEEKNIWVRDYPKLKNNLSVLTEESHEFDFYFRGIEDVDFDLKFGDWIHKKYNAKKTIALLGIRAQESLNRHAAVTKETKINTYKGAMWTTKKSKHYFGYPLYDWDTNDIWTANGKFGFDYNKLYDLYYMAGVPVNEMRVASAFIDEGVSSLALHRAIEPNTWSRLVGRVNGANFGCIYGATKAMGYKSISLPKGHTWKSYCDFLLNTLPPTAEKIFRKKFESTFKAWLDKGATVVKTALGDIDKSGYEYEVLGKPKGKIYEKRDDIVLVKFKEYPNEIDSKYFQNLPSYKRMCITILKNDFSCKYMGYGMTAYEKQLRHDAMRKLSEL